MATAEARAPSPRSPPSPVVPLPPRAARAEAPPTAAGAGGARDGRDTPWNRRARAFPPRFALTDCGAEPGGARGCRRLGAGRGEAATRPLSPGL